MNFGLLYELEVPKPWTPKSEYDIFHQAADQVVLAEQMGFDYVWIVEHHFLEEFAHSSAPEVWLGYLAARTSKIRLGHGVVLLEGTINHPVRVAERIATLDIMSDGRVDFGTGRGSNPFQIEPFGVDLDVTREEWEEAVEIIPRMWEDGWFSHKGRFWDIEERNVLPKPLQKPHPPIWVACQQPATFPIAGRKGIGALCFTIGRPGELKERIQSYREAVADPTEQVGKLKNDQVAAFTVAACDENDLAARELAGPQGAWYFDTIRKIYDPAWQKREKGVPASYAYHALNVTQADSQLLHKQADMNYNDLIDNGSFCMGNPDTCIETIQMYKDSGVDQAMMFFQVGNVPHEKIMNSIRLFGKHVIPHFKEAAKKEAASVS